eukprot:PhF_6_TR20764/c0_g1_i3/m.29795
MSDWDEVGAQEVGAPQKIETRVSYQLNRWIMFLGVPSTIGAAISVICYYAVSREAQTVGRIAGAYCMVMCCLMSSLLIYLHLAHYTQPFQQKHIIRILLMCPIYAVDSYLALWNYEFGGLFDLVRDTYESFALYTFYKLLMEYLGGEDRTLAKLKESHPVLPHMKPFCCLPDMVLSESTMWWWKLCIIQYMVLKPVLTLLTIPLHFAGYYEEGEISSHNVWIVFSVLANISVFFAFTVVVYFYHATAELLRAHSPLGKFLAIKAVVFLCFWQSVGLSLLASTGVIEESREKKWSAAQVATGMHDFIVCIEMAILSVVHRYVFAFEPYVDLHSPSLKVRWWKIKHAVGVGDVASDIA